MATRSTGTTRRTPKPKPALSPEEEEREAKRKLKIAEATRKAAQERSAAGRAETIKEILGAENAKACRCPIRPTTTLDDILRMKTCTEGGVGRNMGAGYICPVVDRIRRRLGH
jgi:hypothetical protein